MLATRRNSYYLMRHGQSQANQQGIVFSDPVIGVQNYGLTERGREQARLSAAGFSYNTGQLKIICSDFLRARETAEIVQQTVVSDVSIMENPLLRERYFGELDGETDSSYDRVWAEDALDPDHRRWCVESVTSVLARTTDLIISLEAEFEDQSILLVAHGDVLQILQTEVAGIAPGRHRELPHLGTGQIRPLEATEKR